MMMKTPQLQVVGPRTAQTQPKFHFPAACKWTKTEMSLLRCRFSRHSSEFKWDELWNKAGPIPAELQQRKSQIYSRDLIILGIDAGVKDLEAVKIKTLLNQGLTEDLVCETVSYFKSTFRSLVSLAREKKWSTSSRNIPLTRFGTPTSNPPKRRAESTQSPHSKKSKSTLSPSPFPSMSSPERLTVSPHSQHSQESVMSDVSVQSTDEDYTKLLLLNFAMESINCLGPQFFTPRWREIAARLEVGLEPYNLTSF